MSEKIYENGDEIELKFVDVNLIEPKEIEIVLSNEEEGGIKVC